MLTPFSSADAVADEIRRVVGDPDPTPIARVTANLGTRTVSIRLKREGANRWGSIKGRTAIGLITSVAHKLTRPGAVLVESTSGNLGLALAVISSRLGLPFVAVVDPNLSPVLAHAIVEHGGELEKVSEPHSRDGYLGARLNRVRQLGQSMRRMVWTDQYHNPANPLAHLRGTGPEIIEQTHGKIDAVFVAVSTGGTLAGVGRFLHSFHPHVKVIAVDVPGSRVFGEPRGSRLLTGIGAGIPSSFLTSTDYDDVVIVDDEVAVAHCRALAASTGIHVGGSSGAVLAACLAYLADHPEINAPLCVCPDDGDAYAETLYNDAWLTAKGVMMRSGLLHPAPELPPVRLHLDEWLGDRKVIPVRCPTLARSVPASFMEVHP